MVSAAILMVVMMAFSTCLVSYFLRVRSVQSASVEAEPVRRAAETGLAKAFFCLNNDDAAYECGGASGNSFTGETAVPFDSSSFTTVVTGTGADRTLTSVGQSANGQMTTISMDVTVDPATAGTGFTFALTAGDGGVYLENNAEVSGPIASRADIGCKSKTVHLNGNLAVGLAGGQINGCTVFGDAWADRIIDSSVVGDAYYRDDPADISGTFVQYAKHPGTPTPAAPPQAEIDEDFWRAQALTGGVYEGDYTAVDDGLLGPIKIQGDLLVPVGVRVRMGGAIWVAGNILIQQGASVTLAPEFANHGSGILADDQSDPATSGQVTLENGAALNGSGDPASHILVISTNNSTDDLNPAINVANNAAGAAFAAPNGTIRLRPGALASALSARRLYVDGGATVFFSPNEYLVESFIGLPVGVWRAKPATWRERSSGQ